MASSRNDAINGVSRRSRWGMRSRRMCPLNRNFRPTRKPKDSFAEIDVKPRLFPRSCNEILYEKATPSLLPMMTHPKL